MTIGMGVVIYAVGFAMMSGMYWAYMGKKSYQFHLLDAFALLLWPLALLHMLWEAKPGVLKGSVIAILMTATLIALSYCAFNGAHYVG